MSIEATDALSGTADTSRTRVHDLAHHSLALINKQSVRNKAETICDYITERDFCTICLTDTWLSENDDVVVDALTPDGYNFRHLPRSDRRGSGVGVMYKASFHLCSTTPIPAQSFEGLEVVLHHVRASSVVQVFTIYRPPSSGRKSTRPFRLFIDEFSRVLERAATQQTECVILGDFNVHYGDDRTGDDPAGDDRAGDARHPVSAVSVETLLTDHHVIQCDLVKVKPRRPRKRSATGNTLQLTTLTLSQT